MKLYVVTRLEDWPSLFINVKNVSFRDIEENGIRYELFEVGNFPLNPHEGINRWTYSGLHDNTYIQL